MSDVPVTFKKRAAKANRRKAAPPRSPSPSSSDGSDEEGPRFKRRKTAGNIVTATTSNQNKIEWEGASTYAADRSKTIEVTNDATKQSNWYDEDSKDAPSTKNLLGTARAKPQSFIKKNPNAPDRTVGPVKAPTNIRTITITDYNPEVCKDYKQTGFCGFGDSCKFLHAREDYAQGWQLDRDWEITTKGKKSGGKIVASADRSRNKEERDNEAEAAMLEKIPFACIICKQAYKTPIVTRCGHYFCEPCALQRYRKNPACAACGAGTNGVFNVARNLQKLLDKKRQREEQKKKDEEEADSQGDEH